MRKTAFYVAAWFAAGVGAVALASAGVSMVGNQVTGSRPSPLSAAEVRSELAGEPTTTTTTISEAAGGPSTTLGGGGDDGGGPTATTAPRVPVSGPATTTPPATVGASPSTTTTVAPAASETRTYNLIGGTATLRFGPEGVTVLVATPAPGFAVDVEPTHDTGVRVEFESDTHRSRVEGWWDDGPRDAVDEQD